MNYQAAAIRGWTKNLRLRLRLAWILLTCYQCWFESDTNIRCSFVKFDADDTKGLP